MKSIHFICQLILFWTLVACSQTSRDKQTYGSESSWKTADRNEYSVQYPEDWDIDTTGHMGPGTILTSKQSSEQDRFSENVNITIQDLTGMDIDLSKYVAISEEQINTVAPDGTLLESRRIEKNGSEFHKVIFTAVQDGRKLKFEQYYLLKNEKVYVLTLTCETDQFDRYKETGEKILNSFKLK